MQSVEINSLALLAGLALHHYDVLQKFFEILESIIPQAHELYNYNNIATKKKLQNLKEAKMV